MPFAIPQVRRLLAYLAGLGMLALLAAPAANAQTVGPSQTVERLNATLLGVMREAKDLGYQGRFDRLAPDLVQIFDFPVMAKAAVGRTWKDLDAAQQEALVQAFATFSIGNYARRFDGYSGERFEILNEEPGRRGKILVRNQIVKSDGESVAVDYLTRQSDGQWRVVDVLLDGRHSELASRRSEYSAILERYGFDHLLQSLKDKAAEFAS